MNLFQLGSFRLASGYESPWKVDCDVLTAADWECVAFLLSERVAPFREAVGVPRGGLKLAEAMTPYVTPEAELVLFTDDVWTTGGSMNDFIAQHGVAWTQARGAVLFSRGTVPRTVTALFQLHR